MPIARSMNKIGKICTAQSVISSLTIRKEEVAYLDQLAEDRIGDLPIISEESLILGIKDSEHYLSLLWQPLRSHGDLTEQLVQFTLNKRFDISEASVLRNSGSFYHATLATTV